MVALERAWIRGNLEICLLLGYDDTRYVEIRLFSDINVDEPPILIRLDKYDVAYVLNKLTDWIVSME